MVTHIRFERSTSFAPSDGLGYQQTLGVDSKRFCSTRVCQDCRNASRSSRSRNTARCVLAKCVNTRRYAFSHGNRTRRNHYFEGLQESSHAYRSSQHGMYRWRSGWIGRIGCTIGWFLCGTGRCGGRCGCGRETAFELYRRSGLAHCVRGRFVCCYRSSRLKPVCLATLIIMTEPTLSDA